MYPPRDFQCSDPDSLIDFIQQHDFGQLTTVNHHHPHTPYVATLLPFVCDKTNNRLLTHMAKNNPQLHQLDGEMAHVSFMGPHGYISGTWYEKQPGVSTWDYQVVFVQGQVTLIEDSDVLTSMLNTLLSTYEPKDTPLLNYPRSMLKGIVGLEVSMNNMQGIFKLSQNKSTADRLEVARQLRLNGQKTLADRIEQTMQTDANNRSTYRKGV